MSAPGQIGAYQPATTEAARGDHQGGRHQDDVLEDVLAFEGRRVVGAGEEPGGQEDQRREDADELDRQQPDREPHPRLASRQIPITHSRVAIITIATPPGTRPRKRMWVVALVMSSAGLTPGKNLSTPKPRKIRPTAIRSAAMLCATSW